jgi:hypothetical protein
VQGEMGVPAQKSGGTVGPEAVQVGLSIGIERGLDKLSA